VLKPRAITRQLENVPQNQDGAHVYVIPQVDVRAYDRLALIITRLDPSEEKDSAGDYSIVFNSSET
jgi:hypothetical protein